MSVLIIARDVAQASLLVRWSTHLGRDKSNLRWQAYSLSGSAEEVPELDGLGVEELDTRAADSVSAVLDLVKQLDPRLLLVGTDGTLPPDDPLFRLTDRLLRFAPCDVMVIDPGTSTRQYCEKVLVPMEPPLGGFAVRSAARFAGQEGVIRPMVVGSRIGRDAEAVAETELQHEMAEEGVEASDSVQPVVVLADHRLEGICTGGSTVDLVLIGASSPRLLSEIRQSNQLDSSVAVGLIRPARLPSDNRWKWLRERMISWLPTLKPMERIDLFDRLQAGARWSVDFLVMIGLSSALATLGLLQGSAAVVIGAMVVAPLMTPLIGAGLALIQGNRRLFGGSLRAMGYGVIVSLIVSITLTTLAPSDDLTIEVLARGMPTILDLAVAFLSGIAAAYALARPNVLAALAGVAIAAALVPPLASVGIALANGAWEIAEGAAILFITNLVMIILGAAATFASVGVQGTRVGFGSPLWGRRALLALSLTSMILIAPLGYNTAKHLAQGQIRPMAYPLSSQLGRQIRERINAEPDVTLILAGRAAVAYGKRVADVGLLLSATGPVPDSLRRDLIAIAKEVRGPDAVIKIRVVQEVPFTPDQPTAETPDENKNDE